MYTYRSGDPKTWIPKDQLVEGAFYEGKCRNAGTAQWKEGKFHYLRHKFGFQYMEDIPCPEDDQGYDVFFPQKLIEEPTKGDEMTDRDDIIRMAREAGFVAASFCRWSAYTDDLARFAALVRADEREACAKVCDKRITHEPGMQREDYENRQCAAAIRARGS